MEKSMKIYLADDEAKVRSALRLLLEQETGIRQVQDAWDAQTLLARVKSDCPELVLLDWELPGLAASEIIDTLRRICPELKVIAMSGRPDARQAAENAGADFFVSKSDPPDELLSMLRSSLDRNRAIRR